MIGRGVIGGALAGYLVYLGDMTDELDLIGHHWGCMGVDWPLITDALGGLVARQRISPSF